MGISKEDGNYSVRTKRRAVYQGRERKAPTEA